MREVRDARGTSESVPGEPVYLNTLSMQPRNGHSLGQNWACTGPVIVPGPICVSERALFFDDKGSKTLCSLRE